MSAANIGPAKRPVRVLSRRTVTAGSRIILPMYPVLATVLGLLYIVQDEDRTSGPAFDTAKDLMSISQWGIVFLGLGVFKVAAFAAHNATWLKWSLVVGAALCGFWAALLLWAATQSHQVSYTSALWVFFAALAHIASINSLANDNVVLKE